MNCPVEQSPMGPLVVLPSEAFRMPRCYKLPEEQPETKWEKFAKEKGIKNKKRERMVYDELTDSFRPRYGYQSKKNALLAETPVMEVKTGADPFADPWAEERVAKKQRVKKNEKNQKKNLFRAGKGKKGMPTEYGRFPQHKNLLIES